MGLKVRIDLNNNNDNDDDGVVYAPVATSAGSVLAMANRPGSVARLRVSATEVALGSAQSSTCTM